MSQYSRCCVGPCECADPGAAHEPQPAIFDDVPEWQLAEERIRDAQQPGYYQAPEQKLGDVLVAGVPLVQTEVERLREQVRQLTDAADIATGKAILAEACMETLRKLYEPKQQPAADPMRQARIAWRDGGTNQWRGGPGWIS